VRKEVATIVIISCLLLEGCSKDNEIINDQKETNSGESIAIEYNDNKNENKTKREELTDLINEKFNFVDFKDSSTDLVLGFELSEDEKAVLENGSILSIEGGIIYIFDINGNLDDALFEKLKKADISSWYRYYNEEYFIIGTKSELVMVLANDELNAPETDASIIKNICKELFNEENIDRMYEIKLDGAHKPIEDM